LVKNPDDRSGRKKDVDSVKRQPFGGGEMVKRTDLNKKTPGKDDGGGTHDPPARPSTVFGLEKKRRAAGGLKFDGKGNHKSPWEWL